MRKTAKQKRQPKSAAAKLRMYMVKGFLLMWKPRSQSTIPFPNSPNRQRSRVTLSMITAVKWSVLKSVSLYLVPLSRLGSAGGRYTVLTSVIMKPLLKDSGLSFSPSLTHLLAEIRGSGISALDIPSAMLH